MHMMAGSVRKSAADALMRLTMSSCDTDYAAYTREGAGARWGRAVGLRGPACCSQGWLRRDHAPGRLGYRPARLSYAPGPPGPLTMLPAVSPPSMTIVAPVK